MFLSRVIKRGDVKITHSQWGGGGVGGGPNLGQPESQKITVPPWKLSQNVTKIQCGKDLESFLLNNYTINRFRFTQNHNALNVILGCPFRHLKTTKKWMRMKSVLLGYISVIIITILVSFILRNFQQRLYSHLGSDYRSLPTCYHLRIYFFRRTSM